MNTTRTNPTCSPSPDVPSATRLSDARSLKNLAADEGAGSSRDGGSQAELPRRNAAAVMQELEQMRMRLNESLTIVQTLQQAVSALATRAATLEVQINLLAAGRFGTGPTVRA